VAAHNAANVSDREDCCGAVPRSFQNGSIGENEMRSVLVFGLLMGWCAAANAATLNHHRTRHHVTLRPGVASSFAAVPGSENVPVPPGWYKFPGYPPIPPEQNRNLDPSTFGGG
jgi:hypothetical protein